MKTHKELHSESLADPVHFWGKQAERIHWNKKPQEILSQDEKGFYRWFEDGELNTCYNALDIHIENGRGSQRALTYDSPVTGTIAHFTYQQLHEKVSKLAGGLQSLGIGKGDTVLIYMPMIPEAVMAMLACARIGAIHSVVFGGFAAHEVAIRINDAKPKAIITATSGIEIDRIIPYKPLLDKAIDKAEHKPGYVVVFNRNFGAENSVRPRDIDFDQLVAKSIAVDCLPVKATDPLYILYTSGTTGTPKGIIRDNGGHAVALHFSMEHIYGLQPGEVFWAASDVGWVVGHSYIVYAPLLYGCTSILFEGKPIKTPDASTFWRVIAEHKVNVMFTAPTAIRAIKKEDPEGLHIQKHQVTNSLRYQFLAGERCDAATLQWLQEKLNIPVIDHWWQTESGWPMLANLMGSENPPPVKVGSASFPVPGYDLHILREDGQKATANEEGLVCVKLPLPPGCLPTLWQNDLRFQRGYLEQFPGYYFSGDGGFIDDDGYVYITGRVDDIINVAGHRLSTAEMEEVVAHHPNVSECAVIGAADELKGQIPFAFVVVKNTSIDSDALKKELIAQVREKIGPVAAFKTIVVAERLPKTRSGKIMRKLLRSIVDGEKYTIPGTIDDPDIPAEIEQLISIKKPIN
ncbi:MAG: acetate--CoA ligase [Flavobacteriales bacterium]|nr:MAG: acetate--CoA ligase [Flavobacteriales bacterium]